MNIPIGVEVHCTDGVCGESTYVIINPVANKVTHAVVKDRNRPHLERLVNVKWVAETDPDRIRLSCTKGELATMKLFVVTQYEAQPEYDASSGASRNLRVPKTEKRVKVQRKSVPPGHLAIHRGARVHCTDGAFGRVDEFIVDSTDRHITHMILREGHRWSEREVTVPVAEIKYMDEEDVHLKLDKRNVKALPAVPVRR